MKPSSCAAVLILSAGLAACQPAEPERPAAAPAAGTAASVAPPTAPGGVQSAQLIKVDASDDGIEVPRVSGLEPAVAARINAVLDRERQDAEGGAEACRRTAEGRDIDYALKAEETYNSNGLLSFRMVGLAFCGGANASHLGASHTFDLSTGEALDVLALTGLDRAELGELAREGYAGEAECKAFLAENLGQGALVEVADAYLAEGGIGVRYVFNVGAAEGCGRSGAVAPLEAVRRAGEIRPPLDRL